MKLTDFPLLPQLLKAFRGWQEDDGEILAAAVAYYAALSFLPLLLVLISGLGLVLEFTQWGVSAREQILTALGEYASPTLRKGVANMLEQGQKKARVGGPIGLAMLVFSAAALFAHFEKAFNRIWDLREEKKKGILHAARRLIFLRLRAFGMLVGLGLLILVVFAAGMSVSWLKDSSSQWISIPKWAWWTLEIGVSVGLNTGVLTLLYKFLPRVEIRWNEAARGGLLAALAWEVGRQILAAVVISSKQSAYGVVGSFIAVMLWIYFATIVVFFAAEYVQVICAACKPENENSDERKLD